MLIGRLLCVSLTVFVLLLPACTGANEDKPPVFKQEPEIQEIKPISRVKIKLKRNAKGQYSWDISGTDADEILEADKKLKKELNK